MVETLSIPTRIDFTLSPSVLEHGNKSSAAGASGGCVSMQPSSGFQPSSSEDMSRETEGVRQRLSAATSETRLAVAAKGKLTERQQLQRALDVSKSKGPTKSHKPKGKTFALGWFCLELTHSAELARDALQHVVSL